MSYAHGQADRRHALSVVAFAALAIGALAASVVYLGSFGLGPRLVYYADFAYAANLETGAPIKVSGIKVGQVTHLALLSADASPKAALPERGVGQHGRPIVRATLSVRAPVGPFVTGASQWSVVTTGIIGDAYLELSPGAGPACEPYTAMRGVDAPHLHHIALASETVLQHLAPLFETQDALGAGSGPLGAPTHTMAPAAQLVQAIVHLLVAHRDDLDAILHDGAQTARDMRQLVGAVRQAVGDGSSLGATLTSVRLLAQAAQRDYPGLKAQTSAALAHLDKLAVRADTELTPAQVQTLLADLGGSLSQLAAASARGHNILDALAQGEGTLGAALRDPSLYDDLRALLHDLRQHPYKLLWRK